MDRGIEIAQGDRQQASSIDEPVAEQRLAEGEPLRAARCRHGGEIDRLANGIHLDLGGTGLTAAHQRGAPGNDRDRDFSGGQQSREIQRAERGMRTHDHRLRRLDVWCDPVEHVLVAVGRQGDQDHLGAGDEFLRAAGNGRPERPLDGAGRDERLARRQGLGAFARWRPQDGLVSLALEKRRHSKRDRPRADDANFHALIPFQPASRRSSQSRVRYQAPINGRYIEGSPL